MNANNLDLPFALVLFVVFGLFGGAALIATKSHKQDLQFQIKIFLIAFTLRFLASVVIYQFGLVDVIKDEDASGWMGGVNLYREWGKQGVGLFEMPSALIEAFDGQHQGYYYMLGLLFYVTDAPARFPAAVLNCFFGALTVVFAFRIAQLLFSRWVAVRVGWWACLFPSLIIWSAQTLKEPVIILLEVMALYGCVHLKLSGLTLRHVLLCGFAIIALFPFRFYAAYIAGAAVLFALALPQFGERKITIGSALGVAALVIPIVYFSGVLVQYEREFEKFDIERIEKFRRNVAVGTGSGVKTDYDMETPGGFLVGTAVGAAHLLLAPFPWQLGGASLRMLMTLPELIVWWWLFFIGVLRGFWYLIRNRFNDIQPFLFVLLGLGLLYSAMFGNVGLAYRQRAQLLPLLLIMGVVGLEQRLRKKMETRRAYAETQVLAGVQR